MIHNNKNKQKINSFFLCFHINYVTRVHGQSPFWILMQATTLFSFLGQSRFVTSHQAILPHLHISSLAWGSGWTIKFVRTYGKQPDWSIYIGILIPMRTSTSRIRVCCYGSTFLGLSSYFRVLLGPYILTGSISWRHLRYYIIAYIHDYNLFVLRVFSDLTWWTIAGTQTARSAPILHTLYLSWTLFSTNWWPMSVMTYASKFISAVAHCKRRPTFHLFLMLTHHKTTIVQVHISLGPPTPMNTSPSSRRDMAVQLTEIDIADSQAHNANRPSAISMWRPLGFFVWIKK